MLADARPGAAADPLAASRAGPSSAGTGNPRPTRPSAPRSRCFGTARRGDPGGVTRTTDAYPIGEPEPYTV